MVGDLDSFHGARHQPFSCGTVDGFTPQDTLLKSASAIGTMGLSSGTTDAALFIWIKLVLSFEMRAGRLEVLPVLVLLYPGNTKLCKRSR